MKNIHPEEVIPILGSGPPSPTLLNMNSMGMSASSAGKPPGPVTKEERARVSVAEARSLSHLPIGKGQGHIKQTFPILGDAEWALDSFEHVPSDGGAAAVGCAARV